MTDSELFGLDKAHLTQWREHWLHPLVIHDLDHLYASAKVAGFELGVASAFRSFERQQAIWNDKASGKRSVLDEEEQPIDVSSLLPGQLVEKIMRWSALPGASRHHWGTDFDVYDATAVSAGHKLQLTVGETLDGGPFADFHRWLDSYLEANALRFFRPYGKDRGGVAIEPWHLSHTSTAAGFQSHFSRERLKSRLTRTDLRLKAAVLDQFDALFSRFIWVPWSQYPVTGGVA